MSWCCKQVELKPSHLHKARFTNCSRQFRGRAWHFEILVRIGAADKFPMAAHRYGGYNFPALEDRLEALVALVAHELTHLVQFRNPNGLRRDREYSCEWMAHRALLAFRADRETLLAAWSKERQSVAACSPVVDVEEEPVMAPKKTDNQAIIKLADRETKAAAAYEKWYTRMRRAVAAMEKQRRLLVRLQRQRRKLESSEE